MEGERLRVCPATELAGFRAEHVRDGSVGIHESEGNEEADTEDAPPELLESPEDIGMSEALEPEVLGIEVRQRHEAAHRDECGEYPEQVRLKFKRTSSALLTPSVPKDAPH